MIKFPPVLRIRGVFQDCEWLTILGSWLSALGAWRPTANGEQRIGTQWKSRSLGTANWNVVEIPKPRDSELERSGNPEASGQGIANSQPPTANREPIATKWRPRCVGGTDNRQPLTANPQPPTENREPIVTKWRPRCVGGTDNREPRTREPLTAVLFLALLLSSCVPHEKLVNFNQGPDFPAAPEAIAALPDLRIQPDDQLQIVVSAQNPASNAPFPFSISSTTGSGDAQSNAGNAGFIVDKNGTIDFPGLGTIPLAGLTLEAARDTLRDRLLQYLTDPTVSVRFLNFKFTVLGEVGRPATYSQPDVSITLLEAIGQAGDVTPYGNREDILIIREQDGYRQFGHVNLRDRDIFASPFFYLRQNDVIYVAPTKNKTATVADRATRIISYASAGIAVLNLIVILARL